VQTLDAALAGQSTLLADAPPPFPAVCRDPRRRLPRGARDRSSCQALVTGDDDLLAIDPGLLDVGIVTPRQPVDRLD
jgi:hypothetical protein